MTYTARPRSSPPRKPCLRLKLGTRVPARERPARWENICCSNVEKKLLTLKSQWATVQRSPWTHFATQAGATKYVLLIWTAMVHSVQWPCVTTWSPDLITWPYCTVWQPDHMLIVIWAVTTFFGFPIFLNQDAEGLRVGVANLIDQWVKGQSETSRQSLCRVAVSHETTHIVRCYIFWHDY